MLYHAIEAIFLFARWYLRDLNQNNLWEVQQITCPLDKLLLRIYDFKETSIQTRKGF
jgi:hypothetical protein